MAYNLINLKNAVDQNNLKITKLQNAVDGLAAKMATPAAAPDTNMATPAAAPDTERLPANVGSSCCDVVERGLPSNLSDVASSSCGDDDRCDGDADRRRVTMN